MAGILDFSVKRLSYECYDLAIGALFGCSGGSSHSYHLRICAQIHIVELCVRGHGSIIFGYPARNLSNELKDQRLRGALQRNQEHAPLQTHNAG